jgi:protein required for attachment to host cells
MATLDHGLHVLIADGEKALLLTNEGDARHPVLRVVRERHQDNPPTRDQGADRPGRMPDPGPGQVSALPQTDWHRLEKSRFARELAAILYDLVHAGQIDRLIVAAPPRVLGDLRASFHDNVVAVLAAEIPKDHTNHPVHEIERRLAVDLAA